MASRKGFKVGSWVVYPSHGVGKLDAIEKFEICGESMEFFVVSFQKNNLTLKLPVKKALDSGLRELSSKDGLQDVFDALTQKTKKRRLMWSKRAQEYETKINSGNPCSAAEVIRELYKEGGENALSFSERQIYQLAMERLAKEIALVENIEETEAVKRVEEILQKAA